MNQTRQPERLDKWLKLGSGDTKPDGVMIEHSDLSPYPVFGGNGVMGWAAQTNANGENIIIGRVGANCGCVHYYNGKCWITDNALYTKEHRRDYDKRFMALTLQSIGLERLRSKTGQPLVSQGPIHALKVKIPPLPEQMTIANALLLWSGAIEKTERLILVKNQHLSHLREHHLTKPKQFTRIKLKAATRECTVRNGKRLGREAIMAVTKEVGLRPMREETIAATIDRYKVVRPKAFAYNPMRLNIGSIAISSFDDDVLVSPDYVVFECDEAKLLPGYLNHLRRTRLWAGHFEAAGSGGVRIRIYYDDLAAFAFPLPPLSEQARVLAVLDAGVAEIETLVHYLTALKTQKRGLMQKLLTGLWRVKLPSPIETEASSC